MSVPKGKLIIIGGSVDKGSFSESPEDLSRKLKFFEEGILNKIIKVSAKKQLVSHRDYHNGFQYSC